MGMNLCVETLQDKEHPDWDDVRHAGDYEFVSATRDLPRVNWDETAGVASEYYRPADFPAWRVVALEVEKASENHGRIQKLLDLLEADDSYWIRISY